MVLTSTYPHTGGDYHYLTRSYGKPLAFLFAWSRVSVIQTGSLALLAFVFTRAYAAISLVPLTLGLTVFALRSLSAVEPSPGYWWPDLYEKILWARAIQTGLGIGLIVRALYRRLQLLS